jgi:hypothetical protein
VCGAQVADVYVDAEFFVGLAGRCLGKGLARVDDSSGQRPQSVGETGVSPTLEDDAALLVLEDDPGEDEGRRVWVRSLCSLWA